MSFGFFQSTIHTVTPEEFSPICNDVLQQVIIHSQQLKARWPQLRIIHFTSAFRSVGASDMLSYEAGLSNALGLPLEWWVMGTSHEYNNLQNRIIKAIHSDDDATQPFSDADATLIKLMQQQVSQELRRILHPTDVVVCHDAYTFPLVPLVSSLSQWTIWRCHGGSDLHNSITHAVWEFMQPYLLTPNTSYCFSRASHAPRFIPQDKLMTLHPFTQPSSAKNLPLTSEQCLQLYQTIFGHKNEFTGTHHSTPVQIIHRAHNFGTAPTDPTQVNIVCQIGWWNRVKDHLGVLQMFVQHHSMFPDNTYLFLVGPVVKPEHESYAELNVWHDIIETWRNLPKKIKQHVVIVPLPYDNRTHNALMVNALQRLSRIIIQKSIQEGFGLTVTEAMWKGIPVVGSAVGGIKDQIIHGKTGYLLHNPFDLSTCAHYINELLRSEPLRNEMGKAAHQRVAQNFLLPHTLLKYYGHLLYLPKQVRLPQKGQDALFGSWLPKSAS